MSHLRTYLLVEDDEADVTFARREHHRGRQSRLRVVRDGTQAVSYLEGKDDFADRAIFPFPHVVLLDLSLPRMSGLELLAWMRAHSEPAIRNLPVIITSITQYRPDVEKARTLGVAGILTKPIDWKLIENLLPLPEKPAQPSPNRPEA